MAESFLVATGSKKISNLASISGISGSAVIPVVMSNVVGSTYPITNGTTNQISYQDFRESVIENNANIFTETQTINLTGDGVILDLVASNDKKRTTLEGHDFIMSTGSLTEVGFDGGEGFKVELFKNDGVKLYTLDNTEAVPANGFKTFMEIESGYGDVTFTRPVSFDGSMTVNDNLTVNGVLTARQVQTSIVTSSVLYESGSTRFGDTTDDTHEFTGSLKTSGSISLSSLTNTGIVYANSDGELINSSNLTFNGSVLGVNATAINTTAYVNINNNSLKVDGVINNPLIGAVTQSLIDIAGGLQAYTASLKSAAIVSSSNQLFELNNQTGSQGSINSIISIVTASLNAYTASGATSTSNINSFTASQLAVNDLTLAVTSSLITQNTSQGLVNNLTQAVTSSLITQNTSQGAVNLTISTVTASLITQNTSQGLVNNLTQAVTSSLITQNTSQGLVNNLTQAVTQSLITQNTSQGLVNTLTSAVTQSLINQNTSQGAVNLTISGVTASLINQNTSQGLVNNLTQAVTSSLITQNTSQGLVNTLISAVTTSLINQNTSQGLVNNLTQAVTSSLLANVADIQLYTASLKGVAIVSSSTQIENYFLFAETASANTFYGAQTISGSLNVSGSTVQIGNNTLTGNTVLSGSINVSGSTTFNGVHILSGTNTITGNTIMSGSILVSGSSDFKNSIFIVTGSSFFTGSYEVRGNSIFSGSINIASGSSYFRAGNKLFNYGQWVSLETQSGSADTALAVKLETTTNGAEGVYIANNGSGFPTRITVENTGLYNIQFSFQLQTTATETCDFSVWYAMTGSNIANSNTDFSIDKTSGGGNGVAALNFLAHITANDYVELYWSKNTANGQLAYKGAQSTPTRPETPSVIVTVTQIA